MVEGRGGGDSDRYSQGALKSTTNDEWHSSFGCHVADSDVAPGHFQTWAGLRTRVFAFVRGWSLSYVGSRFHTWAIVFVRGRSKFVRWRSRLCVGTSFCCGWVAGDSSCGGSLPWTVIVRGRSSSVRGCSSLVGGVVWWRLVGVFAQWWWAVVGARHWCWMAVVVGGRWLKRRRTMNRIHRSSSG